jgi:flagellar motor switch protein FliN/FliY
MATMQPLSPPVSASANLADPVGEPEIAAEQALVPAPHVPVEGAGLVLSAAMARLPVELDVAVPVREFRVRNLLNLENGQLIESRWALGEDMPLRAGEVQLAWSEFEVVESQLAVRVTRLS